MEKREARERMRAMQTVRALLAARKLTSLISQQCTKRNTIRRLWGRGRRVTMIVRAVLVNIKGGAGPTKVRRSSLVYHV